ncbi:MAG: sulfatase-like hydrolase/transferase [Hyphomicrobiaceae bacterium]
MEHSNLLILVDDQHSKKMLGCYGHPLVKTPNLDALAARGTRFANAYTPSPLCVSARGSIATGRFVHETGCWDNATAYDGTIPSWGHRLQDAGRTVVSIGKLHYRYESDPTGFDEQIIPMHLADGVGDLMGSIRPDLPVRTQSRKYAENVGPGKTPYTDYDRDIAARAEAWLNDRVQHPTDVPWVLFVSFIAPHFPLIVPQEYLDLYPLDQIALPKPADTAYQNSHPWWDAFLNSNIFDRYFTDNDHRRLAIASYLGLCTFTDENIGRVLTALADTGLGDTTRVIFFSDHGDNLGARGIWGKSTMHEESAGIPLIMAGPEIPEGSTSTTPVSLIDVFPTVLESTGVAFPTGANMHATSLLQVANKPDDSERMVFSEYHGAASVSAAYMLRKGRFKYIHYTHYAPELFDLLEDPEEVSNLAMLHEYIEVVRTFEKLMGSIIDPEAVDARAKADQAALIERHGGVDKILNSGGLYGTPVPGGASTRVSAT